MITEYEIQNRGCNYPNLILVYNWHNIKSIDNVRILDIKEIICEDSIVAIWKIKPKNNEKDSIIPSNSVSSSL